jgi:hypothetical protein
MAGLDGEDEGWADGPPKGRRSDPPTLVQDRLDVGKPVTPANKSAIVAACISDGRTSLAETWCRTKRRPYFLQTLFLNEDADETVGPMLEKVPFRALLGRP